MIKHLQTKPLTKSVLRTTQLSQKEIKIRYKQIRDYFNKKWVLKNIEFARQCENGKGKILYSRLILIILE